MYQIENCNPSGDDSIISSQVKLGLLKGFVMFMTENSQLKMCKTEVPNFEDLKTVLPSIVTPKGLCNYLYLCTHNLHQQLKSKYYAPYIQIPEISSNSFQI
jgi:hypothetical protein